MGDRKCAWCGADISHRHGNATTCSKRCSMNVANILAKGRRTGVFCQCPECGQKFRKIGRQKYCSSDCADAVHINRCRERSARERIESRNVVNARNKAWRDKNLESERGRTRGYMRRRAAEQSIALLIMPLENTQ